MRRVRKSENNRIGSAGCHLAVLLVPLLMLGCEKKDSVGEKPTDDTTQTAPQQPAPQQPAPQQPAPQQPDPDDACVAEEAWVVSPSEADAATFPNASKPRQVNNCNFHRWSYQTYLWLTSLDTNGRLVFESFADPNDLFKSDGKGPGSVPYPGHTDPTRSLKMLARVGKSQTTASESEVFQAGPGNKALIDQNKYIVYYTNHLNEDYWNFIVENQFYDLGTLQKDDSSVFPVGCIELKVSWRIAALKQDDGSWKSLIDNATDRFYIHETTISTVSVNEQGKIVSNKDSVAAKMAMVGMHVVGIVKDHHEFIWATFEHVDNAPNYADTPTDKGGPTGPWSFYEPPTPRNETNQFDINDPLAIVNVCLVNPQGGGDPPNPEHVLEINESVQGFRKENASELPKWSPNYYLGGAIWTTGKTPQEKNGIPLNNGAFTQEQIKNGAEFKGSLNLANTTMETFTQNDNCFACHNAGSHTVVVKDKATKINAKPLNLSHFVVNYQATQQTKPDAKPSDPNEKD